MNCRRQILLHSFVRSVGNVVVAQREMEDDFGCPIISVGLLKRLTFYCSISLSAARMAILKTPMLRSLLRDYSFYKPVLDLVSAICVSYPNSATIQFLELTKLCFGLENREEYAKILPISSILMVNVEALPLDDMLKVFQIVIEKMNEFDARILQKLEPKLFLSHAPQGENEALLSPDVLVLLRNLFIKFPCEMYQFREHYVFNMLVAYLSRPGELQQNEICGIILQLISLQIIYINQFRAILQQLARRTFLLNAHLDVLEMIAAFLEIDPDVLQLVQLQAAREGCTRKHARRLLALLVK